MGRPRAFDEGQVLEAAGEAFWTRGYDGTSTRDLTVRTGLAASSLYAAFGDKRTLFRRALEHYLDRTLRERIHRLEASMPPARAITAFFDEVIQRSLDDAQQRGCLLVNSALEASPRDPEFQAAIADEMTLIEAFFHRCLTAARQAGDIPAPQPAEASAKLLLAVLLGLRLLARIDPGPDLLAGPVRPALALLGLPPLALLGLAGSGRPS